MGIYKRKGSPYWFIRITSPSGRRVQCSARTEEKQAAQRLHDKIKNDLWAQEKIGERPRQTWKAAVVRWVKEQGHKRTLNNDIATFQWLEPFLLNLYLDQIDRTIIDHIAAAKEKNGVSPATINRTLEIIRAVLRKAQRDWEWLDKIPTIRMRPEPKGRIRWISREQSDLLMTHLPDHLADMAAFSLATGLRKSNVTQLRWQSINMEKKHAFIAAHESKNKKPIPVPLNSEAIRILQQQLGKHAEFVFTYQGNPIQQTNTKAWRKALQKADITNFRWHDLRHTWASWHVQSGTSLHELQQLGGWSSYEMVLRYAHLSSDQLQHAAERICGTNLVQGISKKTQRSVAL